MSIKPNQKALVSDKSPELADYFDISMDYLVRWSEPKTLTRKD